MYAFDIVFLVYFGMKKRYMAGNRDISRNSQDGLLSISLINTLTRWSRSVSGCLYNNLHVLRTGRKLRPIFISTRTRRFSATKKVMIGFVSIATITNNAASFPEVFCFFQDEAWNRQPPFEIGLKIFTAVGILRTLPQLTVAVVALALFYSFAVLTYLRFYMAAIMALMRCQAQKELSLQEKVSLHKQVTAPRDFQTCNTQNT